MNIKYLEILFSFNCVCFCHPHVEVRGQVIETGFLPLLQIPAEGPNPRPPHPLPSTLSSHNRLQKTQQDADP